MSPAERILTPPILASIREYFPRYPSRRAVVLPALHVVNEALGYVPPEAVAEIAELLEIAPADVQDTLSFYGLFKQDRPQGRVRVWVCRSISCAACGGEVVPLGPWVLAPVPPLPWHLARIRRRIRRYRERLRRWLDEADVSRREGGSFLLWTQEARARWRLGFAGLLVVVALVFALMLTSGTLRDLLLAVADLARRGRQP